MNVNHISRETELPEAVLLDMDGLLLDTESVARDAFFASCKHINFVCAESDYAQLTGHGSVLRDKILSKILPVETDMTSFNQFWWETFHHILSKEVRVKQGASDFLEFMDHQKVKIAVATSSYTQSADTLLSRANLRPYIGIIIGGDQVINAKPAPDIYLKAASSVNVAAKNCIAFEDSDVGTKAAHAAGVPVIQIPDIIAPNAESIALGHLIFNSLDIARDKLGWR